MRRALQSYMRAVRPQQSNPQPALPAIPMTHTCAPDSTSLVISCDPQAEAGLTEADHRLGTLFLALEKPRSNFGPLNMLALLFYERAARCGHPHAVSKLTDHFRFLRSMLAEFAEAGDTQSIEDLSDQPTYRAELELPAHTELFPAALDLFMERFAAEPSSTS